MRIIPLSFLWQSLRQERVILRLITMVVLFAATQICSHATNIFTGSAVDSSKLTQVISFNSVDSRVYGDASFTLGSMKTDKNLTVSYTASDMSVVRIEGGVATILRAGTTQITASQAGNDTVNAAKSIVRTLTVYPKVITVKVDASLRKVYGDDDPVLTYTVSESLIGDDAFSGQLVREAGESVGVYAIQVGSLSAGTNYSINYEGSDFSITKKQLTVDNLWVTTEKTYDGTAQAEVAVSAPVAVGNDEIFLSAKANYEDAKVGEEKKISVSYTISGSESGNYLAPANASLPNGEITAIPLTVSNPELTTVKMYDGNASVSIKSLGVLTGVLPIDTGEVSIEGMASYDSATPGLDKTIRVDYNLLGDAALNYLLPASYVVEQAKILEEIMVVDSQLTVPAMGGCVGEALVVAYDLESGTPSTYDIVFNEFAKANGFEDVIGKALSQSDLQGSIKIEVPSEAEVGIVEADITFYNELGVKSPPYTIAFVVNLDNAFIVKKFDDVLVADNSNGQFAEYQWSKNGEEIDGATGQFYNDPDGISGSYSLAVITKDGEALSTCSQIYAGPVARSVSLSVFPNPVLPNKGVTVRFDQIADADLVGAVLSVYTVNGALAYKTHVVQKSNTIYLPAGLFVGTVNTKAGEQFVFKITVIN